MLVNNGLLFGQFLGEVLHIRSYNDVGPFWVVFDAKILGMPYNLRRNCDYTATGV